MTAEGVGALTGWASGWSNCRAVVIGLGQVGFAVADTLQELGVVVLVVAEGAEPDVINITEVLGVQVLVGGDAAQRLETAVAHAPDFVVLSPGVRGADPVLLGLRKSGVPVWSDLDFAWRVRDKISPVGEWVLAVGSKVPDLATRIIQADGRSALRVGFEAAPLLDALRDPHPYEILIVGVNPASPPLWERFPQAARRPLMTVWSEPEFLADSGVFFDGTTLACVYRKGNATGEALVLDADVVEGARAIGIGLDSPGMSEVGLVEGILCDRAFLEDRQNQALEVSTLEELEEAGWAIPDEVPTILAAVAIARALEVPPPVIAGVLTLP